MRTLLFLPATQRGQQSSGPWPLLSLFNLLIRSTGARSQWVARGEGSRLTGSPLLSWAVGLSSLTAADGDGVEVVKGAQGHPGDGHKLGVEANQDSLGVVERVTEVMDHGDNQGIVPAAQNVDTCQKKGKIRGKGWGGKSVLFTMTLLCCWHLRSMSSSWKIPRDQLRQTFL